jgi:hypothetical protein
LIKNTEEDHPDHQNLINAFEKINTVVDYVNDRKRLAENLQRIMDIQTNVQEEVSETAPSTRNKQLYKAAALFILLCTYYLPNLRECRIIEYVQDVLASDLVLCQWRAVAVCC